MQLEEVSNNDYPMKLSGRIDICTVFQVQQDLAVIIVSSVPGYFIFYDLAALLFTFSDAFCLRWELIVLEKLSLVNRGSSQSIPNDVSESCVDRCRDLAKSVL